MNEVRKVRTWSLVALGATVILPIAVACQPPEPNVAGAGTAGYPYPGYPPGQSYPQPGQPGYVAPGTYPAPGQTGYPATNPGQPVYPGTAAPGFPPPAQVPGQAEPTATPAPAPPPVTPPPPAEDVTKAYVRFVTDNPTVQFVDLCNAPCTLTMSAGAHNLSLTKSSGSPRTDLVTLPVGPSTVTGTYVSKGTAKGVLIFTGILAIVVGGALYYVGTQPDNTDQQDDGKKIGGGVMNGAGWIMLIVGLVIHDEAHFDVKPWVTARVERNGFRLAW
jgi:hypothetical protein